MKGEHNVGFMTLNLARGEFQYIKQVVGCPCPT